MIKKKDLIHGSYYSGTCRNASEARWDKDHNHFVYWRYKFGETFLEEIDHPEDDRGFDTFKPEQKLDTPTKAIPL